MNLNDIEEKWRDLYTEFGDRLPYGMECGVGWKPLIFAICYLMKPFPYAKLVQVKEKFGTLRAYTSNISFVDPESEEETLTTEEQDKQIDEFYISKGAIEFASAFVCETCGAYARRRRPDGHWISVVCYECVSKTEKEFVNEAVDKVDKNVANY